MYRRLRVTHCRLDPDGPIILPLLPHQARLMRNVPYLVSLLQQILLCHLSRLLPLAKISWIVLVLCVLSPQPICVSALFYLAVHETNSKTTTITRAQEKNDVYIRLAMRMARGMPRQVVLKVRRHNAQEALRLGPHVGEFTWGGAPTKGVIINLTACWSY